MFSALFRTSFLHVASPHKIHMHTCFPHTHMMLLPTELFDTSRRHLHDFAHMSPLSGVPFSHTQGRRI